MATPVQGVQGTDGVIPTSWRTPEGVHLFGIRHLSAAGAWHLRRFLDEIRPEYVLIEGPTDASDLIPGIGKSNVTPPIAVLAYTADVPAYSVTFPLAVYSPEYQGIRWALRNRKPCRFIDLPSTVKVPLYQAQDQQETALRTLVSKAQASGEETSVPEVVADHLTFDRFRQRAYEQLAELAGETSYDSFWERTFEHNLETDSYLRAVALHSSQMREITEGWETEADPLGFSINALREAHMQRCIHEVLDQGVPADKIVVVTGAYHVHGLMTCSPMSDVELAELPKVETRLTLMPYSYYRLSTFSGYGAGNYAPYYYELMWDAMDRGDLQALPSTYLSMLSSLVRDKHGYSSTATVIDALRLSQGLQYLHDGLLPTLEDLHDSAVAGMAGGDIESIAECFAALDVGTRIGDLPEGVSQTPIQDDMNRQLKQLRLENYKTVVAQDLQLDLRENRRVQNEKSAFLDLDRSVFLHRLALLDIGFATQVPVRQDSATWAEHWTLCWTPEVEIRVVESVLYGDSIEAAAAYVVKERLEKATDVLEVARLVRTTCDCHMPQSADDAVRKLQGLTTQTDSFSQLAEAAQEMSHILQYGSIRRYDPEPLEPIVQQLFLKAVLVMVASASCSDDVAQEMSKDMDVLHRITQEQDGLVSDESWLHQLTILATTDDRNPLLSGFALSILIERGQASEDMVSTEMSRRLSAGNSSEAGAAWFEGMSLRNRYILLSRTQLWSQLDDYLDGLDDHDFAGALVCLRRALSHFDSHEKDGICELLAQLWDLDSGSVAELLQSSLTQQEESALSELNDLDFGDLL